MPPPQRHPGRKNEFVGLCGHGYPLLQMCANKLLPNPLQARQRRAKDLVAVVLHTVKVLYATADPAAAFHQALSQLRLKIGKAPGSQLVTDAIGGWLTDAGFARSVALLEFIAAWGAARICRATFCFAQRSKLRLDFFQPVHKLMTIIAFINFNYHCRQSRLTETISLQHLAGAMANASGAPIFRLR